MANSFAKELCEPSQFVKKFESHDASATGRYLHANRSRVFLTTRRMHRMSGAAKDREHTRTSRSVLLVVENLPVPYDRRVWQEALALRGSGYQVTIISPATKLYPKLAEDLEG